jgi:archaellum component FlaF (FlaF/FlaG flagellin family)
MKKLLLLGIALFLWQACSNDFEVAAPWEEVPVVYAIISPQDSVTYVRVEKAFLDPTRSALEVAKIADSLYYPENAIEVYMEVKGAPQTRVKLSRVDGVSEGIVRAEGIFATQPNWLYKYKDPSTAKLIVPGKSYQLIIKRADGQSDITAVTTVPGSFTFEAPNEGDPSSKITFKEESPSMIEWDCDENAALCNIDFIIRFREINPTTGILIGKKELKFEGGRNISTRKSSSGEWEGTYTINGTTFFKFLRDNIDTTTTHWRYFEACSIIVEGGGKEIKNYIEAAQANAGITGAEVVNTYTNMSEGFGIFTGKNQRIYNNLLISSATVDDMNESLIARKLNFRY